MWRDKSWQINLFLSLLLAFFLLGNTPNTLAQSGATTGAATGVVTDEQGGVISAALVVAKNLQTNQIREVQTSDDGSYSLSLLPPGNYEISVTVSGFKKTISRFELVLGTTAFCNFTLPIDAGESEVIEVIGNTGVDKTKTESSSNNDRGRIDGLPINRRNFLDFSLTSPRVTPDRTPQQGVAASSGLSFNGLPARANYITIDGLDNNDGGPGSVRSTFSQEAVQEFQVVSDSYSAEFGKAIGGVINIVTRGGTNNLKASLFSLNRGETIAARNAFATIKPEFKQYQFGATLGGAIKKDRAFFFTSFERLSIKQNSIVTISNDIIKSINTQGFPIRNGPIPFGVGTTTFLARTDFQLSPSDSLYIRYNYGRTSNGAGEPFGDLISGSRVADTTAGIQALRDNSVAINNTYISTKFNLVNETRFLYSKRTQTIVPRDVNGPQVNLVADEGLIVFGTGTLLPQPREQNLYQIVNNISLTRGRNQIKFGLDYAHDGIPNGFVPVFSGGFAFFPPLDLRPQGGPFFTGLQAFDPSTRTPQQRAFLTFLSAFLPTQIPGFPMLRLADQGLPSIFAQGFTRTSGPTTKTDRDSLSTFFQDDIKINESLLIKLGLRYDISNVNTLNSNSGNFSPRVSISYRPKAIPKMNIHAAYGLFFAPSLYGPAFVANESTSGALKVLILPFPLSLPIYGSPQKRLPLGESLPANAPFIPQLSLEFVTQPDTRASYSQQTNFGIDYFIGNNMVVSGSYTFVRGLRILSQRNINPIVRPIVGDPLTSAMVGRIDPTRGDVFEFTNAYDSYYNAFTLSFNRRLSQRIGFLSSYTFAKSIDNFIDIRNELQQSVDPTNPLGERGLSLQDVRSRFVFSGNWELSYTKNPFLKDFQLSTIINLESGRPYNLLAGVDLNLNGDNPPGDRPLVGGASIARNSGLTPGFVGVDMRLTRNITFKEKYRLQLHIEAFNLFNRVNISDVNPIFTPDSQGNFNLPSKDGSRFISPPERFRASFAPRQFQLGLKVSF
ncbi:MAG: TonB-dependent receptor [Acidobacteria bacterium]|nr:TonB-dependent receptor [Acidobacteriota bacterium]